MNNVLADIFFIQILLLFIFFGLLNYNQKKPKSVDKYVFVFLPMMNYLSFCLFPVQVITKGGFKELMFLVVQILFMNIYRGSSPMTPETDVRDGRSDIVNNVRDEEKEIMINIGNKISITLKESYFNELIVKVDQFICEFNNGLNILNDVNLLQDTVQNNLPE
tara:strand:+ start:1275 stop:1763 length:489 start_codon:yes stop_codon:yes gene_type:complete